MNFFPIPFTSARFATRASDPGLHEPIVERELWDSTQLLLLEHAARHTPRARKSAASPLTGKLFDDSGRSLTPSHAVKGERRHRYSVSRNLINGTKESERGGWRLPAPEIERTVASAASTMLSDQAAIANAALAIGLAEHQLPSLFSLATDWMKRLRSEVEVSSALSALVDRVDLIDAGIRVSLNLPHSVTEEHGANANALSIARVFPMQIRRRFRNASGYPRQSRTDSTGRSRSHQSDREGTPMGRRSADGSSGIGCSDRRARRCSTELRAASDSVGVPFAQNCRGHRMA